MRTLLTILIVVSVWCILPITAQAQSLDLSGFGPGIGIREGQTMGVLALDFSVDKDIGAAIDDWHTDSKLESLGKAVVKFACDKGRAYLVAETVDISEPNLTNPHMYLGVGLSTVDMKGTQLDLGVYRAAEGWTALVRWKIL